MTDFLLTIAGFDPTGGAGILRDIRTFNHFGFYGIAVITVNTAQNTKGVKAFRFEDGDLILKQLELILEEITVKGVKLGIPHIERKTNEKIAEIISDLCVPVVFDPVLSPTFGKVFIEEKEVVDPLISASTVITPNENEYKILKSILEDFKGYIVLKGVKSGSYVEDQLIKNGEILSRVKHKRDNLVVRGTGCAFSSALLSLLAKGSSISEAFEKASKFLELYRKEHFLKPGMFQGYSTV